MRRGGTTGGLAMRALSGTPMLSTARPHAARAHSASHAGRACRSQQHTDDSAARSVDWAALAREIPRGPSPHLSTSARSSASEWPLSPLSRVPP